MTEHQELIREIKKINKAFENLGKSIEKQNEILKNIIIVLGKDGEGLNEKYGIKGVEQGLYAKENPFDQQQSIIKDWRDIFNDKNE